MGLNATEDHWIWRQQEKVPKMKHTVGRWRERDSEKKKEQSPNNPQGNNKQSNIGSLEEEERGQNIWRQKFSKFSRRVDLMLSVLITKI